MTQPTLEKIGEAFFEAEAKEDLYNWQVGHYRVWPIIRSRLLKELTVNAGLYKPESPNNVLAPIPPHPVPYEGRRPHFLLWAAVNGFALKPRAGEVDFRDLKKYSAIVIPFYNRTADRVDKFSKPVSDFYGDDAFTFGVGRYDAHGKNPRLEDLRLIFWAMYSFQARFGLRMLLTKDDYAKYDRVVKILESSGAKLGEYARFPRWMMAKFMSEERGFTKIMKAFDAEKVFCINAAHMSVNASAQATGKRVIELQSGVFSKYSLQISWPGSPEIPYLPNEIWTWGDYFTEDLERPKGQLVRVSGCTVEFDKVRKAKIDRDENQMAVFAQPMVGLQLLDFTLEFAKLRPSLNIVFKLHPSNNKDIFNERLAKEKELPANFKLITNEETSLNLIRKSKYSLGVFSTSLIEAAGLGSIPIIAKYAGWQHLEPLVNHNYAALVDSPQDLANRIESLKPNEHPEHFYGELVDWNKLLSS